MKKKKELYMGAYYTTKVNGLVKAVARAMDNETGERYVVYCKVQEGGYATEPLVMLEQKFIDTYVRPAG